MSQNLACFVETLMSLRISADQNKLCTFFYQHLLLALASIFYGWRWVRVSYTCQIQGGTAVQKNETEMHEVPIREKKQDTFSESILDTQKWCLPLSQPMSALLISPRGGLLKSFYAKKRQPGSKAQNQKFLLTYSQTNRHKLLTQLSDVKIQINRKYAPLVVKNWDTVVQSDNDKVNYGRATIKGFHENWGRAVC